MSLVIANADQFMSCLLAETERHIANSQSKIRRIEEIVYNDFPEEYMAEYLAASIGGKQ